MVGLKGKGRATATAKEFRDGVISQISGEGEGCVFTSVDNSKVASTVDDVAKDFAGPSYAPDAKGNPNIEKMESGKRHSFEHGNSPSSEVVGQTSSGLPTVAKNDPVADKNKKVY
jgi:hypothetical protein